VTEHTYFLSFWTNGRPTALKENQKISKKEKKKKKENHKKQQAANKMKAHSRGLTVFQKIS